MCLLRQFEVSNGSSHLLHQKYENICELQGSDHGDFMTKTLAHTHVACTHIGFPNLIRCILENPSSFVPNFILLGDMTVW